MDMKKLYASSAENGSRPHIIHKRFDDQLLLTVYLSLSESSKFVVLEPCTDHGMFKLQQKFYVCSPMNNRLVDMAFYGDEIWCIWRTGKDIACIKSVNIKNGEWKNCILDTTAFEQPITCSPNIKETYLNKIFSSPTYFTENDLKNAIAVYDTSDNYEFVTDYRSKISNAIDTKVSQEMDKYDSSDMESQWQLVEQCSASFYKSCLDYRRKRLAPLGLIWLGPSSNLLVIITNSSFCFLRPTDNIESKIFSMNSAIHENELSRLINVLMLDQKNKASQFLDINIPTNTLINSIKEVYKFDNSNPKVTLFLNGRNICDTVRSLIFLLYENIENLFEKSLSKIFKSSLGVSVISHSFHQVVLTRFDLCCRLLALMELNTRSYGQTSELVIDARILVNSYWILAVFSQDIKLCEKLYLINHQILVKTSFMDCIKSLLEYIWPLNNGSTLANFLLEEKKYNFIQNMAQLLDYSKWDETLVISYMLNNEPDKALDVMKNDKNKETSQFLKTITLFEKHGYYKHAIQIGKHVLDIALHNGDEHMSSMFYSNIFLNNLKIKAYKDAYINILSLKDQDRKLNCLHTFVLTLLENGEKEQLLSFDFSGLQSAVEDIVLKKARSLSNIDAAVYYMFLCSMHDKYGKYKKLATTFYELYLRADTCVEQEQYLRLSLLYLETLSSDKAWFVTTSLPFYSKSVDTNDQQEGLIQMEDLKRLCWLARARQEIEDSTTDMDVQSVISVLIMKHKYKEVLRLSKMWNLPMHYPLRELVKTCLTLVDPEESEKAWIWLADNGVDGNGLDSGKIAWRFLETLVNRYEEKNLTLLHYHVADELLRNKSFLPNWLVKTYKERNIGELLQLYLSYGELLSCANLVFELFEVVIECKQIDRYAYGETVPTDVIECLIVNLKHHNLPLGDELLEKYRIFCDKIVTQETQLIDEMCY